MAALTEAERLDRLEEELEALTLLAERILAKVEGRPPRRSRRRGHLFPVERLWAKDESEDAT